MHLDLGFGIVIIDTGRGGVLGVTSAQFETLMAADFTTRDALVEEWLGEGHSDPGGLRQAPT